MKYVHTNIISKDWKRLAEFYIQVFECTLQPPARDQSGTWLEKGTGVKNAHLKGVHLLLPGYDTGGPTIEIYSYQEVKETELLDANSRGFGHIAFEVDNVQAIYNKVIANGGSSLGDISSNTVEGVGLITFVYLRDPDGNIIEIQHWDRK